MFSLARWLIIAGVLLVIAGGIVYLLARAGIPLGKLPGDIRIVGENITCIFPITTMIVLSILLTIVLNIAFRILGRK